MSPRRRKSPDTHPERVSDLCRFCEASFDREVLPDLDSGLCSTACRDRETRGALLAHEHRLVEFHSGQRLAPEVLVAAELGLTPAAWGRMKRSDRELRDALARGRAREHQRLVETLFREATEAGSVPAAQFLLRCRHGYDDKSDAAPRVNVSIQLPAALTAEQYAKLRSVVSRPVLDVTPRKELPAA